MPCTNTPGRRRKSGPSARVDLIDFESVKPDGARLGWLWHGIGADRSGRIYVAIGNAAERDGQPGNVFLFRYEPRSGKKSYLGSVKDILAEQGNLGPVEHWPHQEGVAKVHCDILEHNDRIYFATHDFHTGDNVESHRGGHFIEYDPQSGQFRDLSRDNDGGVAVKNQGIIAIGIDRRRGQLIGWTYPFGHILLHDLASKSTRVCARRDHVENGPGDVARVVIVTDAGDVFVAYTGYNAPRCLFQLDRSSNALVPTKKKFKMGFFEGLARSKRWARMFIADTDGKLYSLADRSHKWRSLGSILPAKRRLLGDRVTTLRNLALTPDESSLFTVPRETTRKSGANRLYEFDIETSSRIDHGWLGESLNGAMITGNGVWDHRGGFYLSCYFGSDHSLACDPSLHSGLVRIDVADLLRAR